MARQYGAIDRPTLDHYRTGGSRRTFLTSLAATGAGSLIAAGSLGAGAARAGSTDHPAVGTWLFKVVPPSGMVGALPNSLVSLTVDGLAYQVGRAHPTQSPGQGIWEATGNDGFIYTYTQFNFERDGTFMALGRARGSGVLDPTLERWSGPFTFDFYDMENKLVRTVQGMGEATRMRFEGR
jgi:hypothetical protein